MGFRSDIKVTNYVLILIRDQNMIEGSKTPFDNVLYNKNMELEESDRIYQQYLIHVSQISP